MRPQRDVKDETVIGRNSDIIDLLCYLNKTNKKKKKLLVKQTASERP